MKLNFSKHVTVKYKDMFGQDENRKDEKQRKKKKGGKLYFSLFDLGEKAREIENREKNNSFAPTFFLSSQFGRKMRRKKC